MVDIAVSIAAAPGSCTPVSPALPVLDKHVQRSVSGEPGSGVSPGGLLQDVDVQGLFADQFLESSVLLLKVFQTADLLDFHATVFPAPAVVCLLYYTDLTAGFSYRFSLVYQDLCFPQVVDYLFRSEALSSQDEPPLCGPQSNSRSAPVLGGQVTRLPVYSNMALHFQQEGT